MEQNNLQRFSRTSSRSSTARRALVPGSKRTAPRRPITCTASAADSIQAELLQQLQKVAGDEASWGGLEPHFGSKLALQLLEQAQSAAASKVPSVSLPSDMQMPSVNLPSDIQLPSVSFPSDVQLPSIGLPDIPHVQLPPIEGVAGTAAAAADGLAHLPHSMQQQLQVLQLQLQQLASDGATSMEPHFGTRAVTSWLQQALATLTSALQEHLPVLQLPTLLPASSLNTQTHILLSGSHSSSISSTSILGDGAKSMFAAGSGSAAATLDAVKATWQVLGSAAGQSGLGASSSPGGLLPASLLQGVSSLQQSAAAELQQVQELAGLLQAQLLLLPQRGMGGYDFATLCLVAAGVLAAVAASVPAAGDAAGEVDDDIRDGLTHDYDPEMVAAYFKRRPVLVAQRSLQLAVEVAGFGLSLLGDLWTNRLQANEPARAVQLRGVVERLGPACVKVAQALSTRVDLLSPEYYKQVQLLQDRVPPFPCEQAKQVMADAFGRPVEDVFTRLSSSPVAAASLGQVYRGTLRPELGGGEVAVKVQRPDVLEQVCLDLYLMRQVAVKISSMPEVRTDWASLIDNWAVRFLHEMDYTREAANAALFRSQMAAAGVTGIVTADVYENLSNDVVLTTAWVHGEKLSESQAADVRELCNTLLSAYLIQLLDTGLLHADPHPGNLIRTEDGRICVLDFGLMTTVTPEQRIALVEYISHLTTQDWENVARDLQTLGFIPADAGDPVEMGMAEPLGRILVQLSGGGGATKLNIDAVMSELEDLGSSYPFSIPPFFALILRAFSVIEGIALAVDPDYSIVQECFPYLARRLLSDDDPRVQKALRDVLYGNKSRLDVDRLIRLSDAFGAYTTDGLAQEQPEPAVAGSSSSSRAPQTAAAPAAAPAAAAATSVLSPVAKDALLVVFSKKGSYVQQLLVEELVAATDALSREALSETLRLLLGSAPVALAMNGLQSLGPLRPLLLPFTTPLELLSRLAPAVALTPEDEEALGVVRGIFQLVQRLDDGSSSSTGSSRLPGSAATGMVFSTTGAPAAAGMGVAGITTGAAVPPVDPRSALSAAVEAVSDAADVARELQPLLPELLPGLGHTGQLFVSAFTRRVAMRLAEALSLGGSDADEAEREMAMAALGFFGGSSSNSSSSRLAAGLASSWLGSAAAAAAAAAGQPFLVPGGIAMSGGSSSSFASSSSSPSSSSVASSSNSFGYRSSWGSQGRQQQQQGQRGPAAAAGNRAFAAGLGVGAASSGGEAMMPGGGQLTAGRLVTGLVAAPLLMVLTPLAIMSEMQRRHQEQQQQQGDM